MAKIPDVIINDVIGNRGQYALSNVNTGVNYARPVSRGIDVSGLAQGLGQAAQGVMQYNQNEQRNQYLAQQQKEQEAIQQERLAKEREIAKMKVDKASSDSYMIGNKTDILVKMNDARNQAVQQASAEEAQSFFFKESDKVFEQFSKNAPNQMAKDTLKAYTEKLKQGYIPKLASSYAKNQATQNKAYLQKGINDIVQSVKNNDIDWRSGVNALNETLEIGKSFAHYDINDVEAKVKEIKTSAFDTLLQDKNFVGASELLKDKDYTQGLGKDITYNQGMALRKAVIQDDNLKRKDPVGYVYENTQNPNFNDIIDVQSKIGVPPQNARMMSDAQVKDFNTRLQNASNEDDFIQMIGQAKQYYGAYWQNVLKNDLPKTDIPEIVRYAIKIDPMDVRQSDAMALLFNAFKQPNGLKDAFNQTKLLNKEDMSDFKQKLLETLKPYNDAMMNRGYDPNQIAESNKMAETIAQSYYIKNQNKNDSIDFATKTMQSGKQFIETGSGVSVVIPEEYNADEIKNGLSVIQETVDIGEDYKKLLDNKYISSALSFGIRENAYWAPSPNSDGMILVNGMNNGVVRYIPDAQGNPIEFTYEEIAKQSKKYSPSETTANELNNLNFTAGKY